MANEQIIDLDAPIETLPPLSFARIKFPFERITTTGGVRNHVHEFPHAPGGEPEKMGRSLYKVSIICQFHDVPGSDLEILYPDLFPARLTHLRDLFETQITDDLVVPNIGTIRAFCTNWTEVIDVKITSGESVTLEFLEDQDEEATAKELPTFSPLLLDRQALTLKGMVGALYLEPPSIFQQINDAVNSVKAISGIADAATNLIVAKLEGITRLCSEAADQVPSLQEPPNFAVLDALKDVWFSAQQLALDVAQRHITIQTWTVPRVMSVTEISAAISQLGSQVDVDDVIDLNATIDDRFAVQPGTQIRYLVAA